MIVVDGADSNAVTFDNYGYIHVEENHSLTNSGMLNNQFDWDKWDGGSIDVWGELNNGTWGAAGAALNNESYMKIWGTGILNTGTNHAVFNNNGTVILEGNGTNFFQGTLDNKSNLSVEGHLTNYGSIINSGGFSGGGHVFNYGQLTNVGTGDIYTSGSILVSEYGGGGLLRNGNASHGYQTPFDYGIIDNQAGADLSVLGELFNDTGSTVNNAGEISVGSIAGTENANVKNWGEFNNTGEGTLIVQKNDAFTNGSAVSGWAGTLKNEIGARIEIKHNGTLTNEKGILDNEGTIESFGEITNRDTLVNEGSGWIDNRGMLTNKSGADLLNAGTIASDEYFVNWGTVGNTGTVTNGSGSESNAQMLNFGVWNNKAGGSLVNNDEFVNSAGTFNNASGATVTNNGHFTNYEDGIVNNAGNVTNGVSERAVPTNPVTVIRPSSTIENSGVWNNTAGGILTNNELFKNTETGTFNNNRGATVINAGRIVNDGVINNAGTFAQTQTGTITGTGTFNQTGGVGRFDGVLSAKRLNVYSYASVTGSGRVEAVVENQGTIIGEGTGGLTLAEAVSGAGIYGGLVTFAGGLSPGNSPALITMDHGVFAETNTLYIELGGLARGNEYDAVDANVLELDGILDVSLLDLGLGLFKPHLGDTFDILKATDLVGDFSSFVFAALDAGYFFTHDIIDLGDGWETYRLTVAYGTPSDGVSVPEPGSLGLVGLGTAIIVYNRRRKSRHVGRSGSAILSSRLDG